MSHIPFNRAYIVGKELQYIQHAIDHGHLAGDGYFTAKCQYWLEKKLGCPLVLVTHSCTAALEMAALLLDIRPGDEIIMPSYTYSSTATAFVLRGAVPVFIDIRLDTLNMDESKIESVINSRTKAIVPVHYAGIGSEMDIIEKIAKENNLFIIEDAAQGLMSTYKGLPLGTIGKFGAISFHETKNVISGEGGALLVNDPNYIDRAKVMWNKGTDRHLFKRGLIDKYSWVDLGSSFLMSEIDAAFLWAQLEQADDLTCRRLNIWNRYHQAFLSLEEEEKIRRPIIPSHCRSNAHMYYILFNHRNERDEMLKYLNDSGINAIFHYIPLDSSPAGKKYGRTYGKLINAGSLSNKIIRLPIWVGMTDEQIDLVIDKVYQGLKKMRGKRKKGQVSS